MNILQTQEAIKAVITKLQGEDGAGDTYYRSQEFDLDEAKITDSLFIFQYDYDLTDDSKNREQKIESWKTVITDVLPTLKELPE